MFQVFNTCTNEVKLSTPDMLAADIRVDRENYIEVSVGFEPCWEVRYVQGTRVFRLTIEEL